MQTQNITLSIPKEILKKAKLLAVKKNTSLSGLLTEALVELVEKDEGYEQARQRHLAWLEQSADLGTRGEITWKRAELHER